MITIKQDSKVIGKVHTVTELNKFIDDNNLRAATNIEFTVDEDKQKVH